jgi:hypothetical protein
MGTSGSYRICPRFLLFSPPAKPSRSLPMSCDSLPSPSLSHSSPPSLLRLWPDSSPFPFSASALLPCRCDEDAPALSSRLALSTLLLSSSPVSLGALFASLRTWAATSLEGRVEFGDGALLTVGDDEEGGSSLRCCVMIAFLRLRASVALPLAGTTAAALADSTMLMMTAPASGWGGALRQQGVFFFRAVDLSSNLVPDLDLALLSVTSMSPIVVTTFNVERCGSLPFNAPSVRLPSPSKTSTR